MHNLTKHRPIAVARHMWSSFATFSMDRFNAMELCGPVSCVMCTRPDPFGTEILPIRTSIDSERLIAVQYIFHGSHDRVCINVRPFVQRYNDGVIQFGMTDNDTTEVLFTTFCLGEDILEHLLYVFEDVAQFVPFPHIGEFDLIRGFCR